MGDSANSAVADETAGFGQERPGPRTDPGTVRMSQTAQPKCELLFKLSAISSQRIHGFPFDAERDNYFACVLSVSLSPQIMLQSYLTCGRVGNLLCCRVNARHGSWLHRLVMFDMLYCSASYIRPQKKYRSFAANERGSLLVRTFPI